MHDQSDRSERRTGLLDRSSEGDRSDRSPLRGGDRVRTGREPSRPPVRPGHAGPVEEKEVERHKTPKRDLRAELEGWQDERPRAWVADVGQVLVGELVRYSRGEGQYGPAHIAQVREEKTGELRAVWLLHRVLLDEFKRLRPKPGERLGIRRLEDGGENSKRPYRRFALVLDRDGDDLPDFELLDQALDVPDEEMPFG